MKHVIVTSVSFQNVISGSLQYVTPLVFPVSITCGGSKPTDLAFLEDNIRELQGITQRGIVVDGRHITVSIQCVVCDAPAKALIKATKQFSGYYGCDQCEQMGEWHNKMTYPYEEPMVPRTDQRFRERIQEEHHKGVTPFTMLPIDMVRQFPMDYMHQVCLGVMRRLLVTWFRGPIRTRYRMSSEQRERVDGKLLSLRPFITKEFARKPRSLTELEHWKATEFCQFLLYTGRHALDDIMDDVYYQHFLVLSVACSILVSPQLVSRHIAFAKELLRYFVSTAATLYGRGFMVYNVHSLLHIGDHAEAFGSLDNCAGFPFENHLQKIKKTVRSGRSPLIQTVKRLHEFDMDPHHVNLKVDNAVRVKPPNNAYMIDDNTGVVLLSRSAQNAPDGTVRYNCDMYQHPEPIFNHPCDSRVIGLYQFRRAARITTVTANRLKTKALKYDTPEGIVFHAILHQAFQ